MIKNNNIAVLTGSPTRTLQFGEIWHFFEQQLHYPVAVLEAEYINSSDLKKYDVLILPDGWYGRFLDK